MMVSRRALLAGGGGALVALSLPLRPAVAAEVVEIEMRGTARGERVWFAPQGIAVAPGTTVRFVNKDRGNSHTATTYHPDVLDRQLRIPEGAEPWDSDYLLPDESFEVTLTAPGVYDYYCQPHEMAGMVGRIVVGTPEDAGWSDAAPPSDDLEPEVLAAFPAVETILAEGRVESPDAE